MVFLCNGPECWKSYKASRAAMAAGYTEDLLVPWRHARVARQAPRSTGTAGPALA